MQRFIGGVLVLVATTGAGIAYGRELQKYLEKLMDIRQIVYLLKGEITYSGAPLYEVLERVSLRVKEPYQRWLREMRWQIEERTTDEFLKIWSQSIDDYLAELHLKNIHMRQLKELGMWFGQLDIQTADRTLQLYLSRLEQEIELVRVGIVGKKRIGNCLGVMGGIFLVVMLI